MMAQDTAQALYDIEQIKQLKARYFRFLDAKQWSEWRKCFADDMHHYQHPDPQPRSTTGDQFVANISRLLDGTTTVHHGHMPEIELTSPTTARGVWAMFDWVDHNNTRTPERTHQGYGHYFEEYVKGADGGWRIKRLQLKRIRVEWLNAKR